MPEIIIQLGDNIVHKYTFDKDIISVGRARDNDIVIENLSVSRNHARVRKVDGKYIITDLNSANGTYVNGVQITKTELENNDSITIGKHKLTFINKPLTDEQIISDAFGADRTMIVDKTPNACLIVTKGGQKDQEFKITKYETSIGRSAENDVRLHDWFVSKKHAMVIRQGMAFFIKDLGSWRGMKVNGKQVKEFELKDGDEIEFGTTTLVFRTTTEGEADKGTGRVPKELSVDDKIPSLTPIPDDVSDEELAEVLVSSDADDDVIVSNAGNQPEQDIDMEEFDDAESKNLQNDLKDYDIDKEQSIEEQLGAEQKQSEEMMMGFEKIEDEEDLEENLTPQYINPMEDTSEQIQNPLEEEIEISEEVSAAVKAEKPQPLSNVEEKTAPEPSNNKEVALWEKALQNKSPIIRKQALTMLKKLTGKDYDYE